MLSSQEEQAERRRVFAQDQSVQRQATTMLAHAIADAAIPRGRFSAVEAATVVGANPVIDYPAGPAWSADPGAQCVEPPLGLDNPALTAPVEASCFTQQATDPTSDDPSPLGHDVGSLSHSGDMTADGEQSRSQSDGYVVSPVRNYRRF
jgi:hypothetical protein